MVMLMNLDKYVRTFLVGIEYSWNIVVRVSINVYICMMCVESK